MKRSMLSLVLAGAMSFFAASCAKKTIDDQALKTAVQSKLYGNETTRQGNVAVSVKDGVVTLSGDVPGSDVELEAMKVANTTDGVRSVSDQMKVTSAAASMPAVPPPDVSSPAASNMASKTAAAAGRAAPDPEPPARKRVAKSEPEPERKPVRPESATLPAGTRLAVRTSDTIDSKTAREGQTYRASLDSPLTSKGRVIVPAGTDVTLTIRNVKNAGRIKGNSTLSLAATTMEYRGKSYDLASSVYSDQGKGRGKNTALKTGLGAAAGALIGGLAGGGKGAGIGAAAGGGAGFGWNAFTHGDQVKIPAETVLNFRLESALTVPVSKSEE